MRVGGVGDDQGARSSTPAARDRVPDPLAARGGERLLVIWDGSPIHCRSEVRDFVSGTHGKVWLEATPGYAPDLNPWDEGGWHHLKHVQMRNVVCRDLEDQDFSDWAIHDYTHQPTLSHGPPSSEFP